MCLLWTIVRQNNEMTNWASSMCPSGKWAHTTHDACEKLSEIMKMLQTGNIDKLYIIWFSSSLNYD